MPKFGKWTSVWGIVTILLIIETIIFVGILIFYHNLIIEYLDYLGWILLVLSIYFALAPVYIFKKKAGVPEGKSYIHTKTIIDTGIFSIVRHPQYLAFIIMTFGMTVIASQTSPIINPIFSSFNPYTLLFVIWMVEILAYIIIGKIEDFALKAKYRDEYMQYANKVSFMIPFLKLKRKKFEKE